MQRMLTRLAGMVALTAALAAILILAIRVIAPPDRAAPAATDSPSTAPSAGTSASPTPSSPPNVVILLADDLRRDKFTEEYMPNTWALSQRTDAVTFTNAFVSNPLCCPSRTTILTGRYSHTTGVWNNEFEDGGFKAFDDDAETLAVDFQSQGYRTAMIGKYLNGYEVEDQDYVPPGWDVWFAVNTGAFFNYPVRTKNASLVFGAEPEDYISTVLGRRAIQFVRASADPFFLYLSFTAPHTPSKPDPRDEGRFDGEPDWPVPEVAGSSALDSAYSMDRAIGELLEVLPDDTVVLFMSDNGSLWEATYGTHGSVLGKRWPYDPSVHVPMVLAGLDAAMAPLRAGADDLVVNVDLRASLLHAAGLAPLAFHEGLDWFGTDYAPRDHVLLEHSNPSFAYCGIRTATELYVRFSDGGEEFYDLSTDPGEQRNLMDTAPPEATALRRFARAECLPLPPGFRWDAP